MLNCGSRLSSAAFTGTNSGLAMALSVLEVIRLDGDRDLAAGWRVVGWCHNEELFRPRDPNDLFKGNASVPGSVWVPILYAHENGREAWFHHSVPTDELPIGHRERNATYGNHLIEHLRLHLDVGMPGNDAALYLWKPHSNGADVYVVLIAPDRKWFSVVRGYAESDAFIKKLLGENGWSVINPLIDEAERNLHTGGEQLIFLVRPPVTKRKKKV